MTKKNKFVQSNEEESSFNSEDIDEGETIKIKSNFHI